MPNVDFLLYQTRYPQDERSVEYSMKNFRVLVISDEDANVAERRQKWQTDTISLLLTQSPKKAIWGFAICFARFTMGQSYWCLRTMMSRLCLPDMQLEPMNVLSNP